MDRMITAREVYECTEPDTVRQYYDMLRSLETSDGELAMLLHRAHRNSARIERYDDPRYIRFLSNRKDYAFAELLEYLHGSEKMIGTEIHVFIVLRPLPGAALIGQVDTRESHVVFTSDADGWQTSKRNGEAIFAFCDSLTGADNAE